MNSVHTNVLVPVFFAWLITQTCKVMVGVIREKRFDFRWFVGAGGMPSSHAATVCSLTTAIGMTDGVNTPLFALSLIFSIIVLFDAQGIRRTIGMQANILNKIVDDIYWKGKIQETRLKELLGHTPVEVLVGALSGVVIAMVVVYYQR